MTRDINIVHETEAQRRHARIRVPARLTFGGENEQTVQCNLMDLSASGFAVQIDNRLLKKGSHYSGQLLFMLNSTEFRLPIKFMVLYWLPTSRKAGCEFAELGSEEISILRLFLSRYLAGELTTAGEIMTTLNRDNFTKARGSGDDGALKGWRKLRALVGTGLAAGLGLAAFAAIVGNLYQHYLVTHPLTAAVHVDRQVIEAPVNGYFEMLADTDGIVKAGEPLAMLSSPVLDYLKAESTDALDPETLKKLLPNNLSNLVKSPCAGHIFQVHVRDNEFIQRGDMLIEMVRAESKPFITAVFSFKDADDLQVGKTVRLQFPGESATFSGTITDLRVDTASDSGNVVADIEPDRQLPLDRIMKPIHVAVAAEPIRWSVVDTAAAIERTESIR